MKPPRLLGLIEQRRKHSMSQNGVARKLGTTQQTISRWEAGRVAEPSIDNLLKLAKLFDCSLDDLINFKGKRAAR